MSPQQAQKQFAGALLSLVNDKRRVIGLYIVLIFVGGSVYSAAEGKSLWDGVWWAIISSLSIGYGDQYPVTIVGRIDGIVVGVVGIMIIVPLIIGLIIKDVLRDLHQFTDFEQRVLLCRTEIGVVGQEVIQANMEVLQANVEVIAQMLVKLGDAQGIQLRPLQQQLVSFIDQSALDQLRADARAIESQADSLLI